jgi:hypothetical protein
LKNAINLLWGTLTFQHEASISFTGVSKV